MLPYRFLQPFTKLTQRSSDGGSLLPEVGVDCAAKEIEDIMLLLLRTASIFIGKVALG